MKLFLIISIGILCHGIARAGLQLELPGSHEEAILMLAEGSLDSALWQQFEGFYTQPLSVPSGELRYLMDIVPELAGQLPVTALQLKTYEPWSVRQVEIFLKDYPGLIPYLPVISFESSAGSHWGSARFAVYKPALKEGASAYWHLRFFPHPRLRISGVTNISDTTLAWGRRSLMFRPLHLGALYAGNYNLSPNGGIVYGHFPGAGGRVSGNPVRDNWLYGSTLSWNGLMWQYDEAGYSAIQAFYHERELERAWGALTGFKTGKRFDVYAGCSRLLVETPLDTGNLLDEEAWTFVHLRGRFNFKSGSGEVNNVTQTGGGSKSSQHFTVTRKAPKARYNLTYTHFQQGFYRGHSSLWRKTKSALRYEGTDTRALDSLNEQAQMAEASYAYDVSRFFYPEAGAQYTEVGGVRALNASLGFTGGVVLPWQGRPVRYSLAYIMYPALEGPTSVSWFRFNLSDIYAGSVSFSNQSRFIIERQPGRQSYSYNQTFTLGFMVNDYLDYRPYARFYRRWYRGTGPLPSGSEYSAVGFTHNFSILKNTGNSLQLEWPLQTSGAFTLSENDGDEFFLTGLKIHARLDFYL